MNANENDGSYNCAGEALMKFGRAFQILPKHYGPFESWHIDQTIAEQSAERPIKLTQEHFAQLHLPNTVRFETWVQEQLTNPDQLVSLTLGREFSADMLNQAKARIGTLGIAHRSEQRVMNQRIHRVELGENTQATFAGCYISSLNIGNGASVILKGCWVGELRFSGDRIKGVIIEDGGVLTIAASKDDALVGDVSIRTFFPRFDPGPHVQSLQSLRNMRRNLVALHNTQAAGFFHSIELSLSRRSDTWVNRLFGWCYEVLSDFGNSTARPFIVLVLVLVLIAGLSLEANNLVATTEVNDASWQRVLQHTGWEGQVTRALTYAVHSLINPFGIFSSKALVLAGQTLWVVAYGALSVLGIFSLALFILALRRRFRLEQ